MRDLGIRLVGNGILPDLMPFSFESGRTLLGLRKMITEKAQQRPIDEPSGASSDEAALAIVTVVLNGLLRHVHCSAAGQEK